MACIKGLQKVIEIRQQIKEVERQIINMERQNRGLPPLRTWGETVRARMRKIFIESCCSCCLYDLNPRLRLAKCVALREGTYANCLLKTFAGFVSGLFLSFLIYLMMIYHLMYNPKAAGLTSMGLGIVLSFGLAFVTNVRCIVGLSLPNLCSKQGRSALLAYIFVLVITHPVANFRANVDVLTESTTCGQEAAKNATRDIINLAMSPINEMREQIRELMDDLVAIAENFRTALNNLNKLFDSILDSIHQAYEWLGNMVNVCNERMSSPYEKCINAFNKAYDDCRSKLPKVLRWLCNIVSGFDGLCNMAKAGEFLCKMTARIVSKIQNHVRSGLQLVVKRVSDMFYFNVTLQHHYNVTTVQSKSFKEVRSDIKAEIEEKFKHLGTLLTISNFLMFYTFFMLLLKALLYRHKYLTRDRFDNCYLTWTLLDIDAKLKQRGKETVFPLNAREKRRFIFPNSFRMTQGERRKLLFGLVLFIISFVHASFYMICDYGLYWLLNMLKQNMKLDTNIDLPAMVKMHVQGAGVLADLYKKLINEFDPAKLTASKFETSLNDCQPMPFPPNFEMYRVIGTLFAISLFLVLFEAYLMRLRHIVARKAYPKRESQRAAWLVHHILQRRGGYAKYLRNKLRTGGDLNAIETEETSLKSKIAARSQLCAKIFRCFGYERKFCLSCAAPGKMKDMENFVHCDNYGCKAVYCQDCLVDINNLCTQCMNPVDYANTDFSQEKDSSCYDEPIPDAIDEATKEMKLMDMLSKFGKGLKPKSEPKPENIPIQ